MSMIDLLQVHAQIDAVIARHKARTDQILVKFMRGADLLQSEYKNAVAGILDAGRGIAVAGEKPI